jgi:hypothetical protein
LNLEPSRLRAQLQTGVMVLLLLAACCAHAQKVSTQVTNMSGFDLVGSNLVITVSIGEPAIVTFTQPDFILTQGFLQPEILPCTNVTLDYYPNPAEDELTVELKGCDAKISFMQLIDPWGRLIKSIPPKKNNKVYIGDVSPGVYFLRVWLSNSLSETLKIAKVSN